MGALSELIFWSQLQEEPPKISALTGALLQTLSDLMRKANDAQGMAVFTQKNHTKHSDGTISVKYQ